MCLVGRPVAGSGTVARPGRHGTGGSARSGWLTPVPEFSGNQVWAFSTGFMAHTLFVPAVIRIKAIGGKIRFGKGPVLSGLQAWGVGTLLYFFSLWFSPVGVLEAGEGRWFQPLRGVGPCRVTRISVGPLFGGPFG